MKKFWSEVFAGKVHYVRKSKIKPKWGKHAKISSLL